MLCLCFSFGWSQNIFTFCGNGTAGFSGDGSNAPFAEINSARGVALDGSGNLIIADYYNNRIRKVTPLGIISTLAGNGTAGYGGDGGPASSALLNGPIAVAVDKVNSIYVVDYNNHSVRKINSSGTISTFAGNGAAGFLGDGGPAASAQLYF
ncbi:MAG: NHL domain-containing protein, partial [Bacteroidia bacterium]